MQLETIGEIMPGSQPLAQRDIEPPDPGPGQVLLRVLACGVCHTELDEIEGRTPPPVLPMVPGHQAVAEVVAAPANSEHRPGDRVGVGWIGGACGRCHQCQAGFENLCPAFVATGRDIHGGYAEYMVVDAPFAHPIPPSMDTLAAAPMLCAGAIGYRSLKLANIDNGQALGLTGFGGSAHLVLQLAKHRSPDSPVYVFARGEEQRSFALSLGADWAGDTTEIAPAPMAAIIDTTPAWLPVVSAMEQLAPNGRLVINAIRKEAGDSAVLSDIDYPRHLWMEKEMKSVANVTRADIREFLQEAAAATITPEIQCFPLEEANRALVELRCGPVRGAKVLTIADD